MKKLSSVIAATIVTACLLSVTMPAMVFAATSEAPVMAQVQTMPATDAGNQVTGTAQTVDYTLPYPGMLPDSPLYFLKQVRDWILDKLIMDPAKKTEFYILQADKRLAMGVALDAGGKGVLGEQVISKGEKYMYNAEQLLLTMKAQGGDIQSATVDHLTLALAKHAEVLSVEISKAQGAQKAGLTASLTLVQQLEGDVTKLK